MRRFVIHFGDGFAHGLPLEFEAVGVMDAAIEDGICEGRVADDVIPSLDGQLAGDHGRAAAVSLFCDLHQISVLRSRQPLWPPFMQDQQLRFGDAAEQAGKAARQVCHTRRETLSPDQDEASSQLDLPTFGRPGARRRRPGRKTLEQQAKSGDLAVQRHATWGMSGQKVSQWPVKVTN